MELILKSNNEQSMAKILALAKKLNIVIEKKNDLAGEIEKEVIKNRILNFKAKGTLPFGDAAGWEREQREDRALPLS
ncbi:hypothetical protein [Mucilaginibacter paludis]|uniref:Uncharacterized protein n=1 Tax=Mucilaginibacter paludis DSM 18603 TaxID=714943 RepID=H1YC92_9SPHI|nr:hypothetical protein [Mucilaginibacter paludis]EHQ30083.1 hypothetical protein Mucpa_6024 [Mucilaginibacter paludis DSM 18603]